MKRLVITSLALCLLTGGWELQAQNGSGNGKAVIQERQVPAFTTVIVEGAVEIILSQGNTQKVTVETDADLQEMVKTTVSNDALTISAGKVKGASKLDIRVTAATLNGLIASGATEVESEGVIRSDKLKINASGASDIELQLDVQSLDIQVSGASSVDLKGRAVKLDGSVSGAGDLNAREMPVTNATIKTSGASSAKLNVSEEVNADVSGVSELSFTGEPRVKNINSKGMAETKGNTVSIDGVKVITNTKGDSTVVRVGEVAVQVIDGDTTIVRIGGNRLKVDDDGNVEFTREKKKRFDGHWAGFDMGVNGYLNADNEMDLPSSYDFLDLRLEKSINVSINFWEQNFNLACNQLGLVTGLGLEFVNYRFDNTVRLDGSKDRIALLPEEEGQERMYSKSKLVVDYLRVPLILEYQTNRHAKVNSFHISGGVIGGLRIGSHTKMVWDDGGKQKNKVRDDFHLNPLKAEGTVRIGWGVLNLYANYSLLPLFKEDEGPELYPFSIGLTLSSW